MSFKTPTRPVRIQLLGPRQSGKTALLFRYCDDTWVENPDWLTIGSDFKIRTVTVDRMTVKVKVNDMPNRVALGDNVATDIWLSEALDHCDAAMVVFDANEPESTWAQACERWLAAIRKSGRKKIVTALIANKLDLVQQGSLSVVSVDRFENSLHLGLSAKSGSNVNEAFEQVIRTCLERATELEWSEFTPEHVRKLLNHRQADNEMAESDAQICLKMIRDRVLGKWPSWAEKEWKLDLSSILGKDGEPETQRRRLARARLGTLCENQGLGLAQPKFGDAGMYSVWIRYANHSRQTVAMEVETQRLRHKVMQVVTDGNVDCVGEAILLKHPYCMEFDTAENVAAAVRDELIVDKKFDATTVLEPTEIGSEATYFKFRLALPPI